MRSKRPMYLAALFAGLTLAPSVPAQTPPYVVTHIPPLETPGRTFQPLFVAGINKSGQVAATVAAGPARAIRYTLGGEVENLHPSGAASSAAMRINERGQVFGIVLERNQQLDVFIHTPGEGFDFLEKGKRELIRTSFRLSDMNDRGDLVGAVRLGNRFVPFMYTREEGWRNLSRIAPRFTEEGWCSASEINNRGDVVLTRGARCPGILRSFLWSDGKLYRLGENFNRGWWSSASDLNEAGQVTGYFFNDPEPGRAYVFTVGEGFLEIPFRPGSARWITDDGVVGGILSKEDGEAIFIFDSRAKPAAGVTVVARLSDIEQSLRQSLPGRLILMNVEVVGMNDKAQFLGMGFLRYRGKNRWRPFMASLETGVVDLGGMLDDGEDYFSAYPISIFDRGDIYLLPIGPDSPHLLILSPVQETSMAGATAD